MSDSVASDRLSPSDRRAVLAALLGWTMDAFDYFVVVLVYADIAKDFRVSLTRMAFLTTVTLDHAAGRRRHLRAVGRPRRVARRS